MITTINDIAEHLNWLDGFLCDESFSTPFCDRKRIISVSGKDNNILLGAYKEDKLTGIFCLMVLEDEKTIETIFMYCRDSECYEELMEYLSDKYWGYEVWFVFNPKIMYLRSAFWTRKRSSIRSSDIWIIRAACFRMWKKSFPTAMITKMNT